MLMHELMEDCPPLEMLVELRQTEGRRQRRPLKLVR